ncbi:hypothetical protein BX666DRAFT_1981026 [Dichotomocladium elegans]|nr:hypothetical protein BX666DRAFT_1981026 [Dichotomocladium elegans]
MTIVPLPFEIAHCSSWDDDHSPEQLVASSPGNRKGSDRLDDNNDFSDTDRLPNNKVKGWQTPKCPNYPQDLIIRLLCGPARISKVQILSHHYKIATKIDVYIGILKDSLGELDDPIAPNEDDEDMLIEFTRLGYVCLDNNARAQYRARELKSIKVNTDGEYVRLVIRSCHRNRLNTYNQVGILALNIQGQPLRQELHAASAIPGHMVHYLQNQHDESSMLSSSTRRTSVSSGQSMVNRLSTTGVVDIEIQQWIAALIHAEEQAAQNESYQDAKVFKALSDEIYKYGKRVTEYEANKKRAVESKDYDKAEEFKAEICRIKMEAEGLLKDANIRITRDGRVVPAERYDDADADMVAQPYENELVSSRQETISDPMITDYNEQRCMPQDDLYDEAIEKWTNFDALQPSQTSPTGEDSMTRQSSPASSLSTNAADMLLPPHLTSYGQDTLIGDDHHEHHHDHHHDNVGKPIHLVSPSLSAAVARKHSLRGNVNLDMDIVETPEESSAVDPECVPEPLIDAERANCRIPIRVFGEQVVACILSVKVKCREHGLHSVADAVKSACLLAETNQLDQIGDLMKCPDDEDEESSSTISTSTGGADYDEATNRNAMFIKATLMMIQEAIMDSREHIINLTVDIWRDVNDLCDMVPHALTFGLMERAFSGLLMRSNDANSRIRQSASELILDLAAKFSKEPYSLLSLFIGKPDRVIHNHKDAKARIELVSSAVGFLCIKIDDCQGTIPLDSLMAFVVTYLNHTHDDVRQAAVELVIEISEQVGFPAVSKYIDKDLRLSLAETVKKVAENGSAKKQAPNAAKKLNSNSNALAELRALAAETNVHNKKPTASAARATTASSGGPGATKKRPVSDKKGTTTQRGTPNAAKKTTATASSAARGTRGTTAPKAGTATKTTGVEEPPSKQESDDSKNMCIFCEEINPNFNEDTLISHYYDECPVLTSCVRCQTILEISTLSDHTFTDCAKRHLVKQCTRCKQPVPVEQWLQHTLKKNCEAVEKETDVRCPLCLVVIDPPTDSQWKAHLLNGEGCPKNPRRIRRAKAVAAAPATTMPTSRVKATKFESAAAAPKTASRTATKTPNATLRRKK